MTQKIGRSFLSIFLFGMLSQLNAASAAEPILEDESHGMVFFYVAASYISAGPFLISMDSTFTGKIDKKAPDESIIEIISRFKKKLHDNFLNPQGLRLDQFSLISPSRVVLDSSAATFINSVTGYQGELKKEIAARRIVDPGVISLIEKALREKHLIVRVELVLAPILSA